jgi:hypothetical protein
LTPFQWMMTLLAGGGAFWMMFSYTGPFQWIAEFQLQHMGGSYSEKLTFLLTFLVLWGGLMAASYPMRKAFNLNATPDRTGGSSGGESAGGLIVALVGLGFVAFGGMKIYQAQHAGPKTLMNLAEVETGKAPPSSWVTVKGIPYNDAASTFGSSTSSKSKFVPVVSGENDVKAVGVHLFLKLAEKDYAVGDENNPGDFDGMLFRNDLPGPVRVSWEKEGHLKGDYYVLELRQTPEKEARNGQIMAYIGGAIVGIGLILALVQWLRRPKAAQPA